MQCWHVLIDQVDLKLIQGYPRTRGIDKQVLMVIHSMLNQALDYIQQYCMCRKQVRVYILGLAGSADIARGSVGQG